MKLISKTNIAFIFANILTIILTINVSTQWIAMSILWFTLAIYINTFKAALFIRLEKNVFILITFIYPICETIIKISINENFIPYSWFWLNTLEHFIWAFFFTFMIYFSVKNKLTNQSSLNLVLLLIAFTSLFGNLNEFLEYLLREYWNLSSIVYYPDTIRDMFMNLVGGTMAAGAIAFKFKNRIKQPTGVHNLYDKDYIHIDTKV
jgi:hypothetical protein